MFFLEKIIYLYGYREKKQAKRNKKAHRQATGFYEFLANLETNHKG